jgi:type II secretory pathway pseudopilin PulG
MQRRSGQSLIDVLIASALGALLLVGALSVLAPALRGSKAAETAQNGAVAARGVIDGVRSLASSDWEAVSSLTPGSPYHLVHSSTSTTIVAGEDTSLASSTGMTTFFTVNPVRRNSSGAYVSSGGFEDASTLAMTVSYEVPGAQPRTVSTFLTRSLSRAYVQTDWSGGSGQTAATTEFGNEFADHLDIDFSTTTGSIVLDLAGF